MVKINLPNTSKYKLLLNMKWKCNQTLHFVEGYAYYSGLSIRARYGWVCFMDAWGYGWTGHKVRSLLQVCTGELKLNDSPVHMVWNVATNWPSMYIRGQLVFQMVILSIEKRFLFLLILLGKLTCQKAPLNALTLLVKTI